MKKTDIISLISLNIERDKHLERIIPFLKKQRPDVVCLQEVYRKDFLRLKKLLKMNGRFVPMSMGRHATNERLKAFGVCILTKLSGRFAEKFYYGNPHLPLNVFRKPNEKTVDQKTIKKVFLYGTLKKGKTHFTIGTTHFTWSADGKIDAHQRRDAVALLRIFRSIPDIVFCGDFNAPRGHETFELFSRKFTDHIPLRYKTSIDPRFHRAGKLQLMVDGLFSVPHYRAKNVRLVCGLSDHCAIIAKILRSS